MKFVTNKDAMLRVLSVAQEVINNKSPISILSNILMQTDAKNGKIILKCTNSTINCITSINAEIEEEGETTVFCDKLISIISALPTGDIELESKGIEIIVKPTAKKVKFKIKSLSADKFPEIIGFNENGAFNVSARDFKEMIHQTIFAVATDVNRYFMTGVYFTKKDGKAVFVATDGKRMSLCYYPDSIPEIKGAIIPVKILALIDKICSNEGNILVNVTENVFFFKGLGFEISSTLIAGLYPKWEKVLPENLDQTISVSKKDFETAIKRTLIMTDKNGRIYLVAEDNKLVISSPDTEIGKSDEEIPAVYHGQSAKIALNVSYLNDVLKVIEGNNIFIDFKFNQDNKILSAITIRSDKENQADCTHIIMPMSF